MEGGGVRKIKYAWGMGGWESRNIKCMAGGGVVLGKICGGGFLEVSLDVIIIGF